MRKVLLMLAAGLMTVASAWAQQKADDIIGTYKAVQNGDNSKVEIRKNGDGYRAQIVWLENMKNKDGSPRTDKKNPDKAKRNTPSNQIVLIDKRPATRKVL